MWKDFFYFTKGQRIGIVVLVVLIVITLIISYTLPFLLPVKEKDGSAFLTEVQTFKKSLVLRDSVRDAERQKLYEKRQREYELRFNNFKPFPAYNKAGKYTLFPFDPNISDSSQFVKLGIKPYIASNILKYRKKGGVFKTSLDFGKVYGITPEKFKELEPYIIINESKLVKTDSLLLKPKPFKQDVIVDLNSADTTTLMQVRGIGRGYAKGIVRFRRETGGFVSIEQLREIFGMSAENYEKIRPFCSINFNLVQKIKVNISSVEKLNSHPYLSFYQAKAIYEYRRKKGKIKEINELSELEELTPTDIIKIKPYLSFE
jgi:DNA uptake protein ComE-like DNA-binding protein